MHALMSLWRWALADAGPVAKEAGVSTMIPDERPITCTAPCKSQKEYIKYHIPITSPSHLSMTFSPRFLTSRSMSSGLRLVSAWPYQYASGMSALLASANGAVVAALPSGFAAEEVGMGPRMGETERVPGTDQAP